MDTKAYVVDHMGEIHPIPGGEEPMETVGNSVRSSLYAALSLAQGEILGAVKDSDNPFFKSKYADLASVQDAIREPFAKNGLCVTQIMEPIEGGLILTTVLGHKSGEEIRSHFPVILTDTKPQAVGSQITYARRYALAAIAGVAQIDDDGEAAHGRAQKTVVEVPKELKASLETAANSGLESFRTTWKGMTLEDRRVAQGDKAWFDGLRAKAESVKPAA